MYFDTHFHLSPTDDLPHLLSQARTAGVTRLLLAGAPVGQMAAYLARIAAHPEIVAAVGVHPHEAADFDGDYAAYAQLSQASQVRAIGEIGLDYHYNHSPAPIQREVLRRFLLPPGVRIVDSAEACATAVADYLRGEKMTAAAGNGARAQYFVTDMPSSFFALASRFLGGELPSVDKVSL